MAILEREISSASNATGAGSERHQFSLIEYQMMGEAGIFGDKRIELIEGDILDMAPLGFAHVALTEPLTDSLRAAFGPGFRFRNQAPIIVGGGSKPSELQPDVAVVVGSVQDYLIKHPVPQDIRLLVELADSSLDFDRKTKAALYASASIPEYWIVNLVNDSLEVYRGPVDGAYTSMSVLKATDQITPLFAAGRVRVGDFLAR